jgi:hypothetical protein
VFGFVFGRFGKELSSSYVSFEEVAKIRSGVSPKGEKNFDKPTNKLTDND